MLRFRGVVKGIEAEDSYTTLREERLQNVISSDLC